MLSYGYGNNAWGDQLTSLTTTAMFYDADGNLISSPSATDYSSYDSIGNPTFYNGVWNFEWEGRRLVGATMAYSDQEMTFTYGEDGIRTSKTYNGQTTEYLYYNGILLAEKTNSYTIVYIFDENGSHVGFRYRANSDEAGAWQEFMYEKNIFGDVVAVYSTDGVKLVSYTYDAWGSFETTYHNGANYSSPAALSNIRYRGYYYDRDINYYYLLTRYYDPYIGRFINADSYVSTGQGFIGFNMYSYCGNNPVNRIDSTGQGCKEFLEGLKEKARVKYEKAKDFVVDKVEKAIDYFTVDESSIKFDEDNNAFYYQDNKEFNILNAPIYGEYLKENYYQDSNRTAEGLTLELRVHYFLYKIGNSHGLNGSNMGEASWDKDRNAVFFELPFKIFKKRYVYC